MNDKIISVQFKDDYYIVESLGGTHVIPRDSKWDSIQCEFIQMFEQRDKKEKFFSQYHRDKIV